MQGVNAETTTYRIGSSELWGKLGGTNLLSTYQKVVGNILDTQDAPITASDLFTITAKYHLPQQVVTDALKVLVDYNLVVAEVQYSLIHQTIPGTLIIDPKTESMRFVPTRGYFIDAVHRPLFEMYHVNFEQFDFQGRNMILADPTIYEVEEPVRPCTAHDNPKNLPTPPTPSHK